MEYKFKSVAVLILFTTILRIHELSLVDDAMGAASVYSLSEKRPVRSVQQWRDKERRKRYKTGDAATVNWRIRSNITEYRRIACVVDYKLSRLWRIDCFIKTTLL